MRMLAQATLAGLCAALLLWTRPAAAHAPPQATSVYAGGGHEWVRTNRGIILKGADGELRLLCNDAYGAALSESAPMIALANGLLVATYGRGLLHITPDGCRVTPIELGLGDRHITDLAAASDASRIFALLSPSQTQPGGVLVSSDAGATWQAGADFAAFGTALLVAPSDPNRVYISALIETADGSPANALLVSSDAAMTFSSYPFTLHPSEVRAFALAIDPNDASRVFMRAQPGNPEDPERLLLSEDAGRTFSEVFSATGPLVLALSETTAWLGGKAGLFRSDDRGKTFEAVAGAPSYVGCLRPSADALILCGYQDGKFGTFRENQPALSFAPELQFADVTRQVACGEFVGLCRPNFEDWLLEVLPPLRRPSASDAGEASSAANGASGEASSAPDGASGGGASSAADGASGNQAVSAEPGQSRCSFAVRGAPATLTTTVLLGLVGWWRRRRDGDHVGH